MIVAVIEEAVLLCSDVRDSFLVALRGAVVARTIVVSVLGDDMEIYPLGFNCVGTLVLLCKHSGCVALLEW